jgi:monofunctional glycosyltransferase
MLHAFGSMKVIPEKMLQIFNGLKSAWCRMGQKVASGIEHMWQKRPAKVLDAPDETADKYSGWRKYFRKRPVTSVKADITFQGWRYWLSKTLRITAKVLVIYLVAPYILVPFFAVIDPPLSALMVRQMVTGVGIHKDWVDIEDISPHLVTAVLLAEDASFCHHNGVDWDAITHAIAAAEEGEKPRGASTIPMQTAKNLFLWSNQDYVRKVLEVPLSYYISVMLPKRRVAEIYLNIAEWGPGIFGAEAAAHYHFGKSAATLTRREAALLAASLPNPIRRSAGRPKAQLARLAARIQARMEREKNDVVCALK